MVNKKFNNIYKVKDVEFNYEEINNNNCIISKMAAKMAAGNLILMYLSSDIVDTKTIKVSPKDSEYSIELCL